MLDRHHSSIRRNPLNQGMSNPIVCVRFVFESSFSISDRNGLFLSFVSSVLICASLAVNPGAKERLVQITGANEESIK